MRAWSWCAAALLSTSLALIATPAQANCARPVGYEVREVREPGPQRVVVCPQNWTERVCGKPQEVMLREDVGTGQLVRLGSVCEGACFVDECVAPGTYRYGFATPYTCHGSSCSTDYYAIVSVQGAPASCQRAATQQAVPAPHTGARPWGDRRAVCTYHGGKGGGGCAGATVASGARPPVSAAAWWVLGAQALGVVLGALTRRRRARQRPA